MKRWWSEKWPDTVIVVTMIAIFLGIIAGLVIGTMNDLDTQRACDECIQTNCVEVEDGCACAECIMICR